MGRAFGTSEVCRTYPGQEPLPAQSPRRFYCGSLSVENLYRSARHSQGENATAPVPRQGPRVRCSDGLKKRPERGYPSAAGAAPEAIWTPSRPPPSSQGPTWQVKRNRAPVVRDGLPPVLPSVREAGRVRRPRAQINRRRLGPPVLQDSAAPVRGRSGGDHFGKCESDSSRGTGAKSGGRWGSQPAYRTGAGGYEGPAARLTQGGEAWQRR